MGNRQSAVLPTVSGDLQSTDGGSHESLRRSAEGGFSLQGLRRSTNRRTALVSAVRGGRAAGRFVERNTTNWRGAYVYGWGPFAQNACAMLPAFFAAREEAEKGEVFTLQVFHYINSALTCASVLALLAGYSLDRASVESAAEEQRGRDDEQDRRISQLEAKSLPGGELHRAGERMGQLDTNLTEVTSRVTTVKENLRKLRHKNLVFIPDNLDTHLLANAATPYEKHILKELEYKLDVPSVDRPEAPVTALCYTSDGGVQASRLIRTFARNASRAEDVGVIAGASARRYNTVAYLDASSKEAFIDSYKNLARKLEAPFGEDSVATEDLRENPSSRYTVPEAHSRHVRRALEDRRDYLLIVTGYSAESPDISGFLPKKRRRDDNAHIIVMADCSAENAVSPGDIDRTKADSIAGKLDGDHTVLRHLPVYMLNDEDAIRFLREKIGAPGAYRFKEITKDGAGSSSVEGPVYKEDQESILIKRAGGDVIALRDIALTLKKTGVSPGDYIALLDKDNVNEIEAFEHIYTDLETPFPEQNPGFLEQTVERARLYGFGNSEPDKEQREKNFRHLQEHLKRAAGECPVKDMPYFLEALADTEYGTFYALPDKGGIYGLWRREHNVYPMSGINGYECTHEIANAGRNNPEAYKNFAPFIKEWKKSGGEEIPDGSKLDTLLAVSDKYTAGYLENQDPTTVEGRKEIVRAYAVAPALHHAAFLFSYKAFACTNDSNYDLKKEGWGVKRPEELLSRSDRFQKAALAIKRKVHGTMTEQDQAAPSARAGLNMRGIIDNSVCRKLLLKRLPKATVTDIETGDDSPKGLTASAATEGLRLAYSRYNALYDAVCSHMKNRDRPRGGHPPYHLLVMANMEACYRDIEPTLNKADKAEFAEKRRKAAYDRAEHYVCTHGFRRVAAAEEGVEPAPGASYRRRLSMGQEGLRLRETAVQGAQR